MLRALLQRVTNPNQDVGWLIWFGKKRAMVIELPAISTDCIAPEVSRIGTSGRWMRTHRVSSKPLVAPGISISLNTTSNGMLPEARSSMVSSPVGASTRDDRSRAGRRPQE